MPTSTESTCPPFYHLAPFGTHPHDATQTTQLLDAESVSAMIHNFRQTAAAEPHFPGLLVDFDHFSHQPDRATEAAGWIVGLEERENGLWAQIRWTDSGLAAVQGGRYRFLSPVWLANDCETIAPGQLRPRKLHRAALTNDPNLRGLVPLTNRHASAQAPLSLSGPGQPLIEAVGTAPDEAASSPVSPTTTTMNASLLQELELPTGAAENEVLAAVQELKNRVTAANAATQQLLEAQVENDLHQHQANFQPEARPQWKEALLQNRAGTLALLRSIRAAAAPAPVHAPLHHRVGACTPAPILAFQAASGEGLAERQKAAVAAYQNRSACSFEQAWKAVKLVQPELFPIQSIASTRSV